MHFVVHQMHLGINEMHLRVQEMQHAVHEMHLVIHEMRTLPDIQMLRRERAYGEDPVFMASRATDWFIWSG